MRQPFRAAIADFDRALWTARSEADIRTVVDAARLTGSSSSAPVLVAVGIWNTPARARAITPTTV